MTTFKRGASLQCGVADYTAIADHTAANGVGGGLGGSVQGGGQTGVTVDREIRSDGYPSQAGLAADEEACCFGGVTHSRHPRQSARGRKGPHRHYLEGVAGSPGEADVGLEGDGWMAGQRKVSCSLLLSARHLSKQGGLLRACC